MMGGDITLGMWKLAAIVLAIAAGILAAGWLGAIPGIVLAIVTGVMDYRAWRPHG